MSDGRFVGRGIEFKIPLSPPSMNSIYNIIHAKRMVYLKPDVKKFKDDAKFFVPRFEVGDMDMVQLNISVFGDWYYKNGKLKRADVHNLTKVIVDLICEKQGWDDKHVYQMSIEKVQNKSGFIIVGEKLIWDGECK